MQQNDLPFALSRDEVCAEPFVGGLVGIDLGNGLDYILVAFIHDELVDSGLSHLCWLEVCHIQNVFVRLGEKLDTLARAYHKLCLAD